MRDELGRCGYSHSEREINTYYIYMITVISIAKNKILHRIVYYSSLQKYKNYNFIYMSLKHSLSSTYDTYTEHRIASVVVTATTTSNKYACNKYTCMKYTHNKYKGMFILNFITKQYLNFQLH